MITANQLSRMRERSERFLTGTCTIYQTTRSQSATGSPTKGSPTVRASGVPCRIAVANLGVPQERQLQLDQRGVWLYYWLTLEWDRELDSRDTVRIGTTDYEVVAPDPDLLNTVRKRVMLRRLANAQS